MRLIRLFYGETSDLRMFDGEIVGQSATGVRQGGGSHGDAVLRRRLPGGKKRHLLGGLCNLLDQMAGP